MAERIRRVLLSFDYGTFLWASRTGSKPFEPTDWSAFDVSVPEGLRRRCERWHRREEELLEGGSLDETAHVAEGLQLAAELTEAPGVPVDYVE